MLARLVRRLPEGGYLYEPKWDGFRCVAMRDGDGVSLWSRHRRPFTRYFPELVESFGELRAEAFTVDGEVLVEGADGFDFAALLARLHPARSRVERLSRETPARFVAFDLVSTESRDLRDAPFVERRRLLEDLLAGAPPALVVTPITDDPKLAAAWLDGFVGGGVDGVVAKRRDLLYEPGRRSMVKVKTERTADCVVAGYRWLTDRPAIGSLLLGLYDDAGALRHIGVASSFTEAARRAFLEELAPLAVALERHPWADGFLIEPSPLGRLKGAAGRWLPGMEMDWVPLLPVRVCEAAYDRADGDRLRHPARFVRWRPDREARSCTLDQLRPAGAPRSEIL
jgi:ATP-dependent DNA ligase